MKLTLVIRQNDLHVIIKDKFHSFDLLEYGFDARKEIYRGEEGNRLFNANGAKLIKAIQIRKGTCLTQKEKLFGQGSAVFISDRNLNNVAIRHYIDFAEQLGAEGCSVYFEPVNNHMDVYEFAHNFFSNAGKEPIGYKKNSGNNKYAVADDSITLLN